MKAVQGFLTGINYLQDIEPQLVEDVEILKSHSNMPCTIVNAWLMSDQYWIPVNCTLRFSAAIVICQEELKLPTASHMENSTILQSPLRECDLGEITMHLQCLFTVSLQMFLSEKCMSIYEEPEKFIYQRNDIWFSILFGQQLFIEIGVQYSGDTDDKCMCLIDKHADIEDQRADHKTNYVLDHCDTCSNVQVDSNINLLLFVK